VTVVEGDSIPQIAQKMQDNGVCSKVDFLSTVNSYDFSYYPLVKQIQYDPSRRCYKLEGYLFPDTYTFYLNSKPQDAIGKMLTNTESKIGSKYSFSGMTTDQVITLASIIQKEAPDLTNMKKISSVFHNRLDPKNKISYLGADSTVFYLTKYLASVNDAIVEKYKKYYNTNIRIKGLPEGPICSPGTNALTAAANPENTLDLYFYSDSSGYHYSVTGNHISSVPSD
jgi:UPF0755 protein